MSVFSRLFGSVPECSPSDLARTADITLVLEQGEPRGFLITVAADARLFRKIATGQDFLLDLVEQIDIRIRNRKFTDPRIGLLPEDLIHVNDEVISKGQRALASKDFKPLFGWNTPPKE